MTIAKLLPAVLVATSLTTSAGAVVRESPCQPQFAPRSPDVRVRLAQAVAAARGDGCDGFMATRGGDCRNHSIRMARLQTEVTASPRTEVRTRREQCRTKRRSSASAELNRGPILSKPLRSMESTGDLQEWERISAPHPIPPARQNVRLVGQKFLATPEEEFDFERIARNQTDPFNDALVSVVAWVGGSVPTTAVAQEGTGEDDLQQLASAE